MRRRAGAIVMAIAAATSLVGLSAGPALAECPFVPPWPKVTTATPSARVILIGQIVTDFSQSELHLGPDQISRDYALRVTEVLRGNALAGDLIDVQYLLPNWPWTKVAEGDETIVSCSYLEASPGEVIALAFDAFQPGGLIQDSSGQWIQPPTRYNAMGVIQPGQQAGDWADRELVTLDQLRELSSLPATDADQPVERSPGRVIVILLAGLSAFVLMRRGLRIRPR